MKTFNYSVSQVNHSKERIDEYDKALDIVQASSIRRPTRSLVTFCVSTITVVEMLFFPKFMSDIVTQQTQYPVTSALLASCNKSQATATKTIGRQILNVIVFLSALRLAFCRGLSTVLAYDNRL